MYKRFLVCFVLVIALLNTVHSTHLSGYTKQTGLSQAKLFYNNQGLPASEDFLAIPETFEYGQVERSHSKANKAAQVKPVIDEKKEVKKPTSKPKKDNKQKSALAPKKEKKKLTPKHQMDTKPKSAKAAQVKPVIDEKKEVKKPTSKSKKDKKQESAPAPKKEKKKSTPKHQMPTKPKSAKVAKKMSQRAAKGKKFVLAEAAPAKPAAKPAANPMAEAINPIQTEIKELSKRNEQISVDIENVGKALKKLKGNLYDTGRIVMQKQKAPPAPGAPAPAAPAPAKKP